MASERTSVVTRFAPSPTGFLHIGGARTALFNWLFARHHGGKALLRIEDTDRKRSTQAAIDAIIAGLDWLGLDYDGAPVFQSDRAERHAEVARKLLASGHAYKCYASSEELEEMRAHQRANKQPIRYDGRWRNRSEDDAPADASYTVRLKTPDCGSTTIEDAVQGAVTVKNAELDDYIILRADGTPTYMLAAVVDDHDMGCTHVIRGDDHLNNAFRQLPIYDAMNAVEGGWARPVYAHIPLIHGSDGAKLSKRHGALGVEVYRDELGILPDALFNYLLRLGWAHGDRDELSRAEAIELFTLGGVGKSPSRFDMKKLKSLNGHYLRETDDAKLAELISTRTDGKIPQGKLIEAMPVLKVRANNILELADSAAFLDMSAPLSFTVKATALLTNENRALLAAVSKRLAAEKNWTSVALEATLRAMAEDLGIGLGKLAQPMRAALTGTTSSPGIFDVLTLLGRNGAIERIDAQAASPKD